MPILSFERILKILEILCKVLLAALSAIGVYNNVSDDSESEQK